MTGANVQSVAHTDMCFLWHADARLCCLCSILCALRIIAAAATAGRDWLARLAANEFETKSMQIDAVRYDADEIIYRYF